MNVCAALQRGWRVAVVAAAFTFAAHGAHAEDELANNTVLIVRHAEKPPEIEGKSGLTATGERRADAYVRYFRPFREDGLNVRVTALYAGADSAGSMRPRLTLEPLSKAWHMPLDASVGTKQPEAMVNLLRAQPHGKAPLICWRHGQIPSLLTAFGASPKELLPNGKWPDDTYDWVIVLNFNGRGQLSSERLVRERLTVR